MPIINFLDNILKFLEQSAYFQGFRFIMGFYLLVLATAIGLLLFYFIKSGYLNIFMSGVERPNFRGKMQKRWDKIEGRINSNNPRKWKAAILDAAAALNEILSLASFPGETLGEKLDGMTVAQFDNIEEIKEANKVKNKIVKEKDFQLTHEEARQTLEIFAEGLRHLEAIT